ncbi:hypothetical protein HMSSN139_38560 [Paenibacillus sp. HMSSN-139]|nr:hypothetical protein HMSSN139_38560 [Paenibacillus sp. HMSSN-139]
MDKLVIEGGKPLSGTIRIHGAKNAALPILAASLLAEGKVQLRNVPRLLDIDVMLGILGRLGCRAVHLGDTVTVDTSGADSSHVPEDLMKQMRSSIFNGAAAFPFRGSLYLSTGRLCDRGTENRSAFEGTRSFRSED